MFVDVAGEVKLCGAEIIIEAVCASVGKLAFTSTPSHHCTEIGYKRHSKFRREGL